MSNELAVVDPKELVRVSTDVAGLCKDAVVKTTIKVGGKNYVKVEGWQTIAAAHGYVAEIESVNEAEIQGVGGLICWSKLIRISDQSVISRASAFLGDDESQDGVSGKKYARYAKVQTRAISRVCSNAFRFVVVLMNAGLETTPAEEIPREGFGGTQTSTPKPEFEAQVLEGPLTEMWTNKGWTYAVVKGIQFSTSKPELSKEIQAIPEGAQVRVTVYKMIVTGGKEKFRPQSIEIMARPLEPSPTQSENTPGTEEQE